jgi:2-oxoisovalerate dehydrogenase E1 component
VERTARAAKALAESGIDAEIIDLRTLNPFDWETVATSVRKTGRGLVAHEDTLSWGYGAELAARIGDRLFEHLDAPVRRVGALDTWVGYEPGVEKATLPQIEHLKAAMSELAAY